MKYLLFIVTFLLSFIISNSLPAQSDNNTGKWSLQLLGGSHIPVGIWGKNVDMARAFGGKLRYHSSDTWVSDITGAYGGYGDYERREGYALDEVGAIMYNFKIRGQKRVSYVSLNQSRYFMRGAMRPYVAAGFGAYWESVRQIAKDHNATTYYDAVNHAALGLNIGIGGENRLTDVISVVLDARYHYLPTAMNMFTVSAGVNVIGPDIRPALHRVKDQLKKHRRNRFSVQLGGGAAMPHGDWAEGVNLSGLIGGSLQYDMFSFYSIALSGFYSPREKTDSWQYSLDPGYSSSGGGIIVNRDNGTIRQYLSHYHLSIDHLVFLTNGKVRPVFMLGTGYYEFRDVSESAEPNLSGGIVYSENKEITEHCGMSVGAGLDIRIHPMASLVAGARYHRTFKDKSRELNMHLLSFKAGINFYAN